MNPEPNDQPPRAPLIRGKLEDAEQALLVLESEVGPLACDEAEGKPGAAAKLAGLNSKIAAAERTRHQLRNALRFALQDDLKMAAVGADKMRTDQFSIFRKKGEARLTTLATMFEALATAQTAYSQYAIQTNEMVVALPSGTSMGIVAVGYNGWGGSWVGNLKKLIAGEMFRVATPDKTGRGARLPFAEAPNLSSDDVTKMSPAIHLMREAHDKILGDIEGQMERLNRDALAVISKTEVLKAVAA
jgi:hypothetical protein